MPEIHQALPADGARVAEVLGRAFVTEPMMTWPLGGDPDDLTERCIRAYALYLGPLLDAGLVWETADGHGCLVLVSPDRDDVWEAALDEVEETNSHDGGLRHERFWSWVASKAPTGPFWHLDSVGVEPGWQGRGIGSALVGFGLARARESGAAVLLETGTARNVALYERLGFQVVEEADAPDGGPHVWFMRSEPERSGAATAG